MRFSEAVGRQVVSTSTAQSVGRVDDFVVDPVTRLVIALRLKKTAGSGDTLAWHDVTAFGTDAVTVADGDRITEAGPDVVALSGKPHRLLGKRALSTGGTELGRVWDVGFDETSGAITAIVLGDSEVGGDRLVGAGSYAVVLRTD